ncbi:UTP--glucose-1-phosphate uridylyltransferase GalU [Gammaproteobacteria bacterium]|nr:UTP--glucose-1-phosphate uridylyltransferase GalU [Gammaproteobacteria bacterium]
MPKKIRTAVFPVAGRGVRFLPATKASPKEMLPIVDKPLIQYAVEEAIAAGAEKLVFITSSSKQGIENHFDRNPELEHALSVSGQSNLLSIVKNIVPPNIDCIYIRQGAPLGLGHAVLCSQSVVGNEPFFVHLADDLINSKIPCLEQMRKYFELYNSSLLGVEHVHDEDIHRYGIVATEVDSSGAYRVTKIVEKPALKNAPSNLAVVGRYIFTPEIFKKLSLIKFSVGNELQLTDAISSLINDEPVYVLPFDGTRYDCGSKLGYLKATVQYGLEHAEIGVKFSEYLKNIRKPK